MNGSLTFILFQNIVLLRAFSLIIIMIINIKEIISTFPLIFIRIYTLFYLLFLQEVSTAGVLLVTVLVLSKLKI